jgi:hypothetical protein
MRPPSERLHKARCAPCVSNTLAVLFVAHNGYEMLEAYVQIQCVPFVGPNKQSLSPEFLGLFVNGLSFVCISLTCQQLA